MAAAAAIGACSAFVARSSHDQHRLCARQRVRVLAAAAAARPGDGAAPAPASDAAALSRRQVLSASGAAMLASAAAAGGVAGSWAAPPAVEALELAPLGKVERVGGEKLTGLSAENVKDILARNLKDGQYFITGDLTPEIFDDGCVFKDPTNQTKGLSRYVKALGLLFDASYSAVQLQDIRVTGPATIEADWRLGGYLRFPWHPRVEAFEGHTVYHLNSQGLIQLQDQTWSISGGKALVESFTPTPGVSTDIKQLLSA